MTNSFSRRGLLMGAATVAAVRLKAAEDPGQQLAVTEEISREAAVPPYAYVGCYTGGSNARGISVFHYDPATSALSLVSIVAPVTSPWRFAKGRNSSSRLSLLPRKIALSLMIILISSNWSNDMAPHLPKPGAD